VPGVTPSAGPGAGGYCCAIAELAKTTSMVVLAASNIRNLRMGVNSRDRL
jgi:hypothetical protein